MGGQAGDMQQIIRSGARRGGPPGTTLRRALHAIRTHLDLDVAYVSQFQDETMVLREVEAPGLDQVAYPGASFSLDDVYCRHILAGRLPELIPDTGAEPLAMTLPITTALPIGAHLSVPIRMPDGSTYGMFCCLGFTANPTLNRRDLQMLRAFADLAAQEIHDQLAEERQASQRADRIQAVLDNGQLTIAYQPIWNIGQHRPVGFECLARFTGTPSRPPNLWFSEAAEIGRGPELELAAVRLALQALPRLPQDVYLAVNVSPETVLAPDFLPVLEGHPLARIVLEVTEHAAIANYAGLTDRLQSLRGAGMRLAVDDAGAGYAGLHHILELRPDLIKLDMGLTRDVDSDPARQALATALVAFARDTGSEIVAEGVETEAELHALGALGVGLAQGYLLGRPMPLAALACLMDAHPPRHATA
jgi:EAL domain-containing protein (putative c-di-GMP-specific phosphodiesterase class I)